MSVENPENSISISNENEVKTQNGEHDQQRFNGLSNGHIESNNSSSHHKHKSSKDKHKDRDRDHKSSKSSSSKSGRDKDSDKHKSSSSSDKDKHKDKERSDKDNDKHRSKDRDKDRHHRDRDRDKHKSSSSHHHSSSHHKSSNKDKDKERDRDKDKEKTRDKEHRDHGKDKERHDKDKERHDKDKERHDKDKERHHKDKEKEKKSSDKDKERKKEHKSSSSHTKDRDRDRERSDKDKDRHHKSSKDKHSSSSTSKSKDKDKERHSTSSKDKERHRDKEKKERQEVNDNANVNANDNKDHVDSKHNIKKIELEPPRNDYDQSCSGFPLKEENNKNNKLLNLNQNKTTTTVGRQQQYKEEISMNFSQASSCDYSMSQFRDDESTFVVKEEMPDESLEQDGGQEENNKNQVKDEPEEEYGNQKNYLNHDDDEEDIPLAKRKLPKIEVESEDDVPLVSRKKIKIEKKKEKEKEKKNKKKKYEELDDDIVDEKPKKKKIKKEVKIEPVQQTSPTKGRKKKEEEPDDVWKWWEEEKREDGVKWTFLEHRGPVFAPLYEPLPNNVKFYYDGKPVRLSNDAEEIATFYAKMLTHDYVTKKQFNDNFFKDWRRSMTSKERELIKDLSKCNFKEMNEYFTAQSEKRKQMTKAEKQAIKEENERLIKEYGFCIIDGHRQRIGNFKLEPPGLFRGRGEHPKMGLVKKRLMPEDILINCSKDSKIPEPPKGHKWKEVRHDNSVTWLASWTENIQGQVKYIMLNPSSKLKGEKDFQKYETARTLDKHIDKIRQRYREEWKSKEMKIRQRGVALYFIDKLALRAGNEKDEEQADTVGCCSLRVEHIKLHKELDGKENVVEFDFLGKDSIRYYNQVEVEKRVFKNLELFMENKKEGDDLFDRLNTMVLNEHLRELMEGLTAKVFRTYNASITLQQQLDLLTDPDSSIPEKLLSYNRANRAVAILCNHQRSIPKSHEKSMENLKEKIRQRREQLEDAETELRDLQKLAKRGSVKEKLNADKKKKQVDRLKEQLKKLELQQTDRDENKTIALGTSKLNYLDPRISVAWCKKHGVPIEKIFNKTQREKFRWAIDMADEDYRF